MSLSVPSLPLDESPALGEPSSPIFLARDQLLPPVAHFSWCGGAFLAYQMLEAAGASPPIPTPHLNCCLINYLLQPPKWRQTRCNHSQASPRPSKGAHPSRQRLQRGEGGINDRVSLFLCSA